MVLGGQAVAGRVTASSEVLGPIDRVDRLYRNHLGEVVLNASTPYAQPFGSGGSDQFAGQKDDPETGMKYFGARYYHATSARWISADSVLVHAYDPRSLNKYACVRNDPVNLVDRLGQWHECAYYSEGQCQWYYFDPTPHIQFWLHEGQDPYEGGGGGGGGSGGNGPWSTTWNYGRYDECKKEVISLGMSSDHLPSLEATRWIVDAYLVTQASPDILAAIWSVETDYAMTMIVRENKNSKGETWSRDWGPLQLNDYWRLDR